MTGPWSLGTGTTTSMAFYNPPVPRPGACPHPFEAHGSPLKPIRVASPKIVVGGIDGGGARGAGAYSSYEDFDFKVPVESAGDCYARYRLSENCPKTSTDWLQLGPKKEGKVLRYFLELAGDSRFWSRSDFPSSPKGRRFKSDPRNQFSSGATAYAVAPVYLSSAPGV